MHLTVLCEVLHQCQDITIYMYSVSLDTKLKAYKAVVLPNLSYACETSTIYLRYAKLFEKAVKNQVARQDSRNGGPEETKIKQML